MLNFEEASDISGYRHLGILGLERSTGSSEVPSPYTPWVTRIMAILIPTAGLHKQ
jgi:hypothetical protein